MPISVVCPSCSGSFEADDSSAGKIINCPKCSELLLVPARSVGFLEESRTVKSRHLLIVGLLVLFTALVVGAGVWWFARNRSVPFRLIMTGGRSSTGNVSMTGASLFLVSGKPAVLFSTVKKPGCEEEFTFVLVFRPVRSDPNLFGPGQSSSSGCTSEGRKWRSHCAFTMVGRRIETVYEAEFNETNTAVAREALTVGGEKKDLTAGHVFLVDLAAEAPTYTQKSVNLPAPIGLQSTEDVERLANAILRTLDSKDPETTAFLR